MRPSTPLVVLLFLTVALPAAEEVAVIRAHVVGEQLGRMDEVVVVTAEKQTVFEHRADFDGGGIVAATEISLKDGQVLIEDFDNVGRFKDGVDHLRTIIHRYTVPPDKVDGWSVELPHGNKITLSVERPGDAGGTEAGAGARADPAPEP